MANVYEIVTQRILTQLEAGTVSWRKPWRGGEAGLPRNLHSGRTYRGVNVFLLATIGHESPFWLTFNQARQLGGTVRKGEKSAPVIFWNWIEKQTDDGKDRLPVLRFYNVFNVAQCDGITAPGPTAPESPFEPIATCERIVAEMPNPPTICNGEPRAYYRPSTDTINMPRPELFDVPESYYATLFHELGHSSGAKNRLGRKGVTDEVCFGSGDYGREELIAEMTSAYLCGHASIGPATLENSASYLDNWTKALRSDSRLVVQAAAAAQKAADWILGCSPEHEEPTNA